jgi:hypothetical protein
LNSQYGGSWSNGGGYLFQGDDEAFAAGAAYNFQHDSWVNTYYGSYEASVVGYAVLKTSGQLLSRESVHKAIETVRNKNPFGLDPSELVASAQQGHFQIPGADPSNFHLIQVAGAYYTNLINIQRTYLYTQLNPIDIYIVPVDIPSLFVQVSAAKYRSQLDAEWAMSAAYDKTLIKLQTSISDRKVTNLIQANKFFIKEFTGQLKRAFGGVPIVRLTPFSGGIPKSDMSE